MILPLSWVLRGEGRSVRVLLGFFLVLWGFLTDFQHSNPIPLTHPIHTAEGGGNGKALAPIQQRF